MHTTSASNPTRPKTEYPLKGNHVCLALVHHANRYVFSNGLALVLLASAACAPGGGQQESSTAKDVKPVPFAAFTVEFKVQDPEFQVDGNFTLGPGNNGINLTNDNVNVKIGQSSMVIPPGSFRLNQRGKMRHKTEVDGLSWSLVIQDLGNGNFGFKATTEGAGQFGQLKPEDVVLSIGDDTGGAKPVQR